MLTVGASSTGSGDQIDCWTTAFSTEEAEAEYIVGSSDSSLSELLDLTKLSS